MVPNVATVLRAPANRESFFDCRVVIAHMRTVATIFLSTLVLGLATFGVEFQDDIASRATHCRSAEIVLQAEHAHPANAHLLALREPNVAFSSFVHGNSAEHVLMVPRKSVREHGAVAKAGREHTRRVNAEVAFEVCKKFIEERVVILTPRGLVSIAFRSDEDSGIFRIKRFQAIVAFILHATGPAAHALHAENKFVRFILVVVLRDVETHGA